MAKSKVVLPEVRYVSFALQDAPENEWFVDAVSNERVRPQKGDMFVRDVEGKNYMIRSDVLPEMVSAKWGNDKKILKNRMMEFFK